MDKGLPAEGAAAPAAAAEALDALEDRAGELRARPFSDQYRTLPISTLARVTPTPPADRSSVRTPGLLFCAPELQMPTTSTGIPNRLTGVPWLAVGQEPRAAPNGGSRASP
jgi:hypothetical protein